MVLKSDGSKRNWDHDKDWEPDQVTEALEDEGQSASRKKSRGREPATLDTKCTLDYRNRPRPVKVLLRYQNQVLHVYTNLDGNTVQGGYSFCLAVKIDIETNDSHCLAF